MNQSQSQSQSPRHLVIASGNRHKVIELRAMAAARSLSVAASAMADHGDAPEIVEDRDTFTGNAVLKAEGIARWLREMTSLPGDTLVVADDSGIVIEALDGAPGVYSARYAGSPTDDDANNAKMVQELRARGVSESPAHYVCVLAVVRLDGQPVDNGEALVLFRGRWDGTARVEHRGTGGFGYDPYVWIDWPSPTSQTVAELSREEKAARSHRGQAMRAFMDALASWLA